MEKEIIFLVALIIIALTVFAYTLVVSYKSYKESIFIHIKTGNRYRIVQTCRMKFKGKWMDAIIYEREEAYGTYVREYEDFKANFKKLSEWKKESVN